MDEKTSKAEEIHKQWKECDKNVAYFLMALKGVETREEAAMIDTLNALCGEDERG